MKYASFTLLFFLLFCAGIAHGQMQQKIEMRIDSIGNTRLHISSTMNAQQWQIWNANYGHHPAALKRDMERAMPAYFLDDFQLDKDDMNRTFDLSLNAYGVCEINKRGKWCVHTDQKNAQLTQLDETKYMLVSSPPEYGGSLQQTYIIDLPDAAKHVKVDEDAFGQSVFVFDMDAPAGGMNTVFWSGLSLLVLGVGSLGKHLLLG